VIQLFVERVLDLDRPATQYRFARLLPWYRAPLALEPITAGPVASTEARSDAVVPFAAPVKDVKASRADRTKRSATLTRNDAVVRGHGLYKAYDSQPVLAGVDMTVRVGESRCTARPKRVGQEHAVAMYQPSRGLGRGTVKVGGRRMGFREDGKPLAA